MKTKKRQTQSGALSLVLVLVALAAVLAAGGTVLVYHLKFANDVQSTPQFDPAAPSARRGEYPYGGLTFLYPSKFQYSDQFRAYGVPAVALTLTDKSQRPYHYGYPPYPVGYPIYNISIFVLSHSRDQGVLWQLFQYPMKETLSLAGQTATAYIEEYDNGSGNLVYQETVVITRNGFDYFIKYENEDNPYKTGNKYVDLLHRIVATMKFSPPTEAMLKSGSFTPPATPT